ncbi:helix-turn-helix domain-containing protein [Plantactinospora sp. CA-290183]|uniref:helix-turn-helix domain-containing protein n=1 Tax=Plantactinospora sp. CA-290183 TaxID=3240006 RepID=UPI003D937110
MRTVLVCVRTPLAAQNVAAAAARLGLAAAVRTAVSDPEAMLRLAERPADVVLADTAVTRPDTVGFTRRVLARAPGAAVLLLGTEDPGVAAATIAAGARGLIQGGDHDLVSVVAKAILLLGTAGRASRGGALAGGQAGGGSAAAGRTGEVGGAGRAAGTGQRIGTVRAPTGPGEGAGAADLATPTDSPTGEPAPGTGRTTEPAGGAAPAGPRGVSGGTAGEQPAVPAVVPAQRGDEEPEGAAADPATPDPGSADPGRPGGTADRGRVGSGPAGGAGAGRSGADQGGAGPRRPALTEREMQVLVGMADGKSNAEIGRELFVSEDTVKTHARRLFRKLGARDRAHAVAAGFRAGLVA